MKGTGKYDISLSGEFIDRNLEREFLHYDMEYYSKIIGPVAVIFGIIFTLFIISDYFEIENIYSFMVILLIRILFLIVSIIIYFAAKKISNYAKLAYLITAYEIGFIIAFMMIIYEYGPIGILAFFSVTAITLAVYITPNRISNVRIISILFNLCFFIFYTKNVENLGTEILLKIIAYSVIFIIFGNIQAYMTNFYRRKQFADSRELLRLSITDSLTGIYNRSKFDQELNWWIDYCKRYGKSLSFVIFDIDDFKKINDSYGHLVGDSVLQSIASVVKKNIRSTDIFARWGGEEFVILLPNTEIGQAIEMTERMRICIQNNKYNGAENVTCSFGLVFFHKNEDTELLLQRADKLLYEAKKRGKNTVAW